MVKNGDLNLKFILQQYFICSLEYISMIVYTNGENHLRYISISNEHL